MTITAETTAYLDAVEQFARRLFKFRRDIEYLVELSKTGTGRQTFDEMIFHAKFITSASAVLKRSGPQTEDTRNLSNELRNGLERVSSLIHTIIEKAPEDVRSQFVRGYFSPTPGHLTNLLALLYELSWVKNYTIDRERR